MKVQYIVIMKLDISKFSKTYTIRKLGYENIDDIFLLCQGNPQYYQYSKKELSPESIKCDLKRTPPGTESDNKYYVGYYDNEKLIGILDLVDGYPGSKFAYIGFFMLDKSLQGAGIGSSLVEELMSYLKEAGFVICRLGIDRDNPQSNHFWTKNEFRTVNIVDDYLIADRSLML